MNKNKLLILTLFLASLTVGFSLSFFLSSEVWEANVTNIPSASPAVIAESTSKPQAIPETLIVKNKQTVKVSRVIDGDTIEIEGGQKIRYIGIDTPETVDPRTTLQCFGREASEKHREMVEGENVILEKDISETDKYGRLLRYVYLPDSNSGIFINDYLVRNGYAHASSYPPDVKYQDQLRSAQQEAQSENRGLWSACSSQKQSTSAIYNKEGCAVKGNIASSGEKIYHMPGQKYYDKTVIDQLRGERYFCTEQEAISASWRKSKL